MFWNGVSVGDFPSGSKILTHPGGGDNENSESIDLSPVCMFLDVASAVSELWEKPQDWPP